MNKNNGGANTNSMMMVVDVVTLALAYFVELVFFHGRWNIEMTRYLLAIVFIFTIVYILSNKEARLYNVTLFFYLDRFYKIITKSWIVASIVTMVILFVFNVETDLRMYYYIFLAFSYILLMLGMIVNRFVQYAMSQKNAPRTAYVGGFSDYQKFQYFLNKTSVKQDIIGYILLEGQSSDGMFNVIGTISELEQIIRSREVDQIYFIHKSTDQYYEIQKYMEICLEMGLTVKVVMDSYVMKTTRSFVSSVGTYPLITYHTVSLNDYEKLVKRFMDIVISVVCLILSSPILIITAIAIKIDSPGPAIFRQKRVGLNGRIFHIYKFRSMYQDAEARKQEFMDKNEMTNGMFKMKNDPRVTRVGKFLRRSSIDELPQLLNVLRGSMSLVGTRPPTLDEVQDYRRTHWRRLSIKPGITGMWQVSGRSDITDFDQVVDLDLKYIDQWSVWLDVRILLKTAVVLFSKSGAY